MTKEEAIKMAKAELECMERDTNGQDEMYNSHKCDECNLNYERGNMGEQKEWLRMAIKALEHTKNEEPAYWYKKGIYPGWLYCSNCGEPWSFNTGVPPYCPSCGRKMRKEKE